MLKLGEILKKESEIGFELEPNERKKFLRFARANALKWMNGEEIKETDDCFFHMVVSKDMTIGKISTLCWIKDKRYPTCRIKFSEFLKEN